jgi:hypothetical protein
MKRNFLSAVKVLSFTLSISVLLSLSLFLTSCDDEGDDGETEKKETVYYMGTTEYHVSEDEAMVRIVDLGDGTGTKTLSADTTWLLDGLVFVNDGQTLTIEAGALIQAENGQGENSSALIVAKGGTILAEGSESEPIIFTAKGDNKEGTGYGLKTQGLWGGVIVLGNATTNNTSETRIEGIAEGEDRALYGGTDDEDNSGKMKYVSIRHGGTLIGADNEINGLTLGGVGSKTEFDYIEIVSNLDDGVEFFGGAAKIKHVVVALCGDDSYDYDEGFHGSGQFLVAIQSSAGNRCAEQDGGPSDNEEGQPYAIPTFVNVSYFGAGQDLMIFRDNAGGHYHNSIFVNTKSGIRIESRDDKHDAYQQLQEGNLTINNCIASSIEGDIMFVKAEKGDEPADADANAMAHWDANGNTTADLGLWDADEEEYVSYIPASGADGGVAVTGFDAVTYQGAFEPGGSNWAKPWSLYFK